MKGSDWPPLPLCQAVDSNWEGGFPKTEQASAGTLEPRQEMGKDWHIQLSLTFFSVLTGFLVFSTAYANSFGNLVHPTASIPPSATFGVGFWSLPHMSAPSRFRGCGGGEIAWEMRTPLGTSQPKAARTPHLSSSAPQPRAPLLCPGPHMVPTQVFAAYK